LHERNFERHAQVLGTWKVCQISFGTFY